MLSDIFNFIKKILNIKNKEEKKEIPYMPYIVIPDLTPPNQILTTDVMTYDVNNNIEEATKKEDRVEVIEDTDINKKSIDRTINNISAKLRVSVLNFDELGKFVMSKDNRHNQYVYYLNKIEHIIKNYQDDINSTIFLTDFSELVEIFKQLGQKPTKIKTFDKGTIARLIISWKAFDYDENGIIPTIQKGYTITIDIIGYKTKQIGDFFRSYNETSHKGLKLSDKLKLTLIETMDDIYHNERCVKLSADNQSYIVEHLPFFKNISLKIYPTEIINDNESNEKDTYSINTFELSNNKNKDRLPIICKILKKN